MLKFYFSSFTALLLSSCGVSVNYLGNSFTETSHIDVYVDQSAIKKSYTIIGKGYEEAGAYKQRHHIEKLQLKAVEKAKQNGADAILFQDYYLLQPGTSISTVSKTDTLTRSVVSTSNTYTGPVLSTGRYILFLKYN